MLASCLNIALFGWYIRYSNVLIYKVIYFGSTYKSQYLSKNIMSYYGPLQWEKAK